VINSAISIYYYFKVIIAMYFKEENDLRSEVASPASVRWVVLLGLLLIALLTVMPGTVYGWVK
jgi:NADH-quinone oxidoreductase subunit N